MAGIWIHPAAITAADDEYWHWMYQHADKPGIGYSLYLRSISNIRALEKEFEGTAHPAWYPSATADTENDTGLSTNAPNNRYYHNLNTDADYAEWSAGADCDTLVINFLRVSGGGSLVVVRDPGGDDETLGTVDTDGATSYSTEATLTGLSIASGDTLRFKRQAGGANARLISFYGYDSSTLAAYGDTFAIADQTGVGGGGRTREMAYQLAPAGSAVKYVGGIAHQGGAFATEVNVTESWVKDGATWTPAAGYNAGEFQMLRESDVDYDTDTILGAFLIMYEFASRSVSVSHKFTASQDLDVGSLFPAMMFGYDASHYYTCKANDGQKFPILEGHTSTATVTLSNPASITDVFFATSGSALHTRLDYASDTIAECMVKNYHVGTSGEPAKLYWRMAPSSSDNGDSWGAKWTMEHTTRRPRITHDHVLLVPNERDRKNLTVADLKPDFWVSGDRGVFGVADAGAVATWYTRDGRLRAFAQGTAANRPTVDVDAYNGYTAIKFDPTANDQYLSWTGVPLTADNGTIIFVAKQDDAASYTVFSLGDISLTYRYLECFLSGASRVSYTWQDSSAVRVWGPTNDTPVLMAGAISSNGTKYQIWEDTEEVSVTVNIGTNDGSWAGDITNPDTTTIGIRARSSLGQALKGHVCEILAWDAELTAAEIRIVLREMAEKWGI